MNANDTPYNESALLFRIAQGDQLAFSQLVRRYTAILYPYLLYWVKNTQQVEELVQDIFVQIWKKRSQLSEISNFSGYLFVIARHQAHAFLKEKLSTPTDAAVADTIEDVLSSPQSVIELKELGRIIYKAIDALPPRRKEVFKLSREGGLTYEEIAERLQISRSTVREHMVEAIVFLRLYLREHWGIIVSLLLWIGLPPLP